MLIPSFVSLVLKFFKTSETTFQFKQTEINITSSLIKQCIVYYIHNYCSFVLKGFFCNVPISNLLYHSFFHIPRPSWDVLPSHCVGGQLDWTRICDFHPFLTLWPCIFTSCGFKNCRARTNKLLVYTFYWNHQVCHCWILLHDAPPILHPLL